jgi:DNA-binding CsgD family transcriptional regulator/PAS domain-containing protein
VATAAGTPSDEMLAVIGALYDAALDERLWPEALRQLTRFTRSQASSFWVLDGSDESRLTTFVSINFDRRVVSEYTGGMARLDPTVRYLLAHPHESIVHDGMLGPGLDEDTRQYAEWHERNVETRYRLVGQADLGSGLQASVALHRARRAGRYQRREIERFACLNMHLKRALSIGVRVGSLSSQQRVSCELLDRSATAIALLDSRGRVVYLNSAAEELVSRHDGVTACASGIGLAAKPEDERLQALIGQTLDSVTTSGRSTGEVMRATRPSGKQPYSIKVTAISRPPLALTVFRPAACVLISDPERQNGPSMQEAAALFKLTPAETRLALSLADGTSLRRSAERLGITYGTARSRLTQLFDKTNTRSQRELLRLLITLVSHD